jgi:hypothetical protein
MQAAFGSEGRFASQLIVLDPHISVCNRGNFYIETPCFIAKVLPGGEV